MICDDMFFLLHAHITHIYIHIHIIYIFIIYIYCYIYILYYIYYQIQTRPTRFITCLTDASRGIHRSTGVASMSDVRRYCQADRRGISSNASWSPDMRRWMNWTYHDLCDYWSIINYHIDQYRSCRSSCKCKSYSSCMLKFSPILRFGNCSRDPLWSTKMWDGLKMQHPNHTWRMIPLSNWSRTPVYSKTPNGWNMLDPRWYIYNIYIYMICIIYIYIHTHAYIHVNNWMSMGTDY